MEEDNPFSAFDWEYSDANEKVGARYEALRQRPSETSVLMDLVNADSLVSYALWSELLKGHPVGELWLETNTDLLATIYLAYGGFFRQALTVLRAWFEIAVYGVYYSAHYGQLSERYEQWRQGMRNAPANMQVLARALATRQDMVIPATEADFGGKLVPIYGSLSEQVHAQGLDVHDLQDGRDNVPRFLPRSFDIWYQKALESFNSVSFLYRVFYPKEIATYLSKSKAEYERSQELAKVLSPLMPDFGNLLADVWNMLGPRLNGL